MNTHRKTNRCRVQHLVVVAQSFVDSLSTLVYMFYKHLQEKIVKHLLNLDNYNFMHRQRITYHFLHIVICSLIAMTTTMTGHMTLSGHSQPRYKTWSPKLKEEKRFVKICLEVISLSSNLPRIVVCTSNTSMGTF